MHPSLASKGETMASPPLNIHLLILSWTRIMRILHREEVENLVNVAPSSKSCFMTFKYKWREQEKHLERMNLVCIGSVALQHTILASVSCAHYYRSVHLLENLERIKERNVKEPKATPICTWEGLSSLLAYKPWTQNCPLCSFNTYFSQENLGKLIFEFERAVLAPEALRELSREISQPSMRVVIF